MRSRVAAAPLWCPNVTENLSEADAAAPISPHSRSTAVANDGSRNQTADAINQRIFEISLDLILVVDKRGLIIRVSPSSEAILGYHADEMVGHIASDFLYPEDLDRTREEMRHARRGRETQHFECRYVHKLSQIITLTWTGVWSEAEQQYFFIGRDITELKETERRLRRSERLFQDIAEVGSGRPTAHIVSLGFPAVVAICCRSDPKQSSVRPVRRLPKRTHCAMRSGDGISRPRLAPAVSPFPLLDIVTIGWSPVRFSQRQAGVR
jgi:PAS domain S-box-containing protein